MKLPKGSLKVATICLIGGFSIFLALEGKEEAALVGLGTVATMGTAKDESSRDREIEVLQSQLSQLEIDQVREQKIAKIEKNNTELTAEVRALQLQLRISQLETQIKQINTAKDKHQSVQTNADTGNSTPSNTRDKLSDEIKKNDQKQLNPGQGEAFKPNLQTHATPIEANYIETETESEEQKDVRD